MRDVHQHGRQATCPCYRQAYIRGSIYPCLWDLREHAVTTHVYIKQSYIYWDRRQFATCSRKKSFRSWGRNFVLHITKELNLTNKKCNKMSDLAFIYGYIACEPHYNEITYFSSLSSYYTSTRASAHYHYSLFWFQDRILCLASANLNSSSLESNNARQKFCYCFKVAHSKTSHDGDTSTTPSRYIIWGPLAADDVSRKHSTTLERRPRGNIWVYWRYAKIPKSAGRRWETSNFIVWINTYSSTLY